jgi:hypothetical protein
MGDDGKDEEARKEVNIGCELGRSIPIHWAC